MQRLVHLTLALATLTIESQACTAFQVQAQDGSWVYGRSMEFGFRLNSDLLIVPRNASYTGTAPNGQSGITWKTQYGYVGMNQSFATTLVSDGMNEKGLVASVLYLPGLAEYQTPDSNQLNRTLGMWELPSYLLGNCATVQEVKTLLPTLLVAQQVTPQLKDIVLPLHLYVSDNKGAALVVEYINGKLQVYDNPLGVLTNSPSFPWHLTNMTNYINLSPINVSQLKFSNVMIKNVGQGSGLLGLPGDFTPPSRFVRAALFSQWATPASDGVSAAKLCFHILNSFDLFDGIVRSATSDRSNPAAGPDITEWVVVHDRTQLKTYYRTYEGLTIESVDLRTIDFNQEGYRKISLSNTFSPTDRTKMEQPLDLLRN